MNEEYIDNVKHLIEQKDADKVKELLVDLHPADIAEPGRSPVYLSPAQQ